MESEIVNGSHNVASSDHSDISVDIELDYIPKLNYAAAQNDVRIIQGLRVKNTSANVLSNLHLKLSAQPHFADDKVWPIDRLVTDAKGLALSQLNLELDSAMISKVNEAENGSLTFTLEKEGDVLKTKKFPIRLLARDEWGGSEFMPQLIAAFVTPNEQAIDNLLRRASLLLEDAGHESSINGYQSKDPSRSYMLVSAIWSAAAELSLTYAEPPKSFELAGQKVRLPQQIISDKLATCLDSTLFMCSAIEQAGLNPVIIFTQGHCFAGFWVQDTTLDSAEEIDVWQIRKAVDCNELWVFETTLMTQRPVVSFEDAVKHGKAQLSEAVEENFSRAIDIRRCRMARINPLASHTERSEKPVDDRTVAPPPLPARPDIQIIPTVETDELPNTPQGRIERWQRKLLDLSLRNRLLNFRDSKQTVPVVCPDIGVLEDRLEAEKTFKIIPLKEENPVGNRGGGDGGETAARDIEMEFAREAFEKNELSVNLTEKDMRGRLTTLYRKAKSDIAEGGTNTLFLAAGFLRWKQSPKDKRSYRAPLLLIPVSLERKSANSDFKLRSHGDDMHVNKTLLEMLKQDFNLRIPVLEGELPRDSSGYDIPEIFLKTRAAIRDSDGFDIVEDCAISTFSFAKFLMWNDLVERTDSLKSSPFVNHLIDSPEKAYVTDGTTLPEPSDIDRRIAPKDLFTPLPADSSQLATVVAAEKGHDMVVIGPPGTGKSQTITNMIAHCLAVGKTVLFVAEKSAALNVVYRRLRQNGLSDACLELHSNKADKKLVIKQLGNAWRRLSTTHADEWTDVTTELKVRRDELNRYVEALHQPGSHGVSVYEAIGLVSKAEPTFKLSYQSVDIHDRSALEELRTTAERLYASFQPVREVKEFSAIDRNEWSFLWQDEVTEASSKLLNAINSVRDSFATTQAKMSLRPDAINDFETFNDIYRILSFTVNSKDDGYDEIIDKDIDSLKQALRELTDKLHDIKRARTHLSANYTNQSLLSIPAERLEFDWREACASFWPFSYFKRSKIRKLLQGYVESGLADPEVELAPITKIQKLLPEIETSPLAFLTKFEGEDTDIEALSEFLDLGTLLQRLTSRVKKHSNRSEQFADFVRSCLKHDSDDTDFGDFFAVCEAFNKTFESFIKLLKKEEDSEGEHEEDQTSQQEDLSTHKEKFASLTELSDLAQAIENNQEHLEPWTRWVDIRHKASFLGLSPLVQAIEVNRVRNPVEEFESAYFKWWLPRTMDREPILRGFSGYRHDQLIKQFRSFDEQVREMASAEILRKISHDLPSEHLVPRKSELGFLRHQMSLKRPVVSIRNLIGQMPTSFTKLAPCVLMSPLSVAQFLPPDQQLFDVVIFDEASQITTWDAIGTIARAKQSVIVGDPKQLPPTNFFMRHDADEDEDLHVYEQDLPSILDEASAAGLPNVQLNWHYRSQDESLIAFSNHHYYDDRLVTFPAPITESGAVQLHKIKGVYSRGEGRFNQKEAEAIAKYAVKQLTDWLKLDEEDRLTLGVITFNMQQQELILDLLDRARRRNPALEWFFEDERDEPVIVRNLENVQGDERDVMLFSITFGPDKAGKMAMSFGAINKDGGEKRLNVAVTRARRELHVFASITADQIDLSRTAALGVEHLKGFLDYAERGAVALPATESGSLGGTESPFEAAVVRALEAKGWRVRTQIGVSGFRIDLAIVHPDKSGAYLAGIECDGATYHRSATARDRDEIRESVLRRLGWEILRIWSTDWFKNQSKVTKEIDLELRELLEKSRAKTQHMDNTDSDPESSNVETIRSVQESNED